MCKLQWKPDWALRWAALGVDYEMSGKDLIDIVKLSGEICQALGGTPPEGFNYELFLDENGQKISKSKGNGLTIEEWLRYAARRACRSTCIQSRRRPSGSISTSSRDGRRVPAVSRRLPAPERPERLENPVWHIHGGDPPKENSGHLRAVAQSGSASSADNPRLLWGFIARYLPGVTPQSHPRLNALVDYAIHYFGDFVQPAKQFRQPTDNERAALADLRDALPHCRRTRREVSQHIVYEIGRREPFLDQKKKAKDGKPGVSLDWFNMLYQVLLGQEKGPRFGSFVAVYGLQNTVDMIDGALARSALIQ